MKFLTDDEDDELMCLGKIRIYVFLVLAVFTFRAAGKEHLIQADETLFSLSKKYDVPISWIMRENGLDDTSIRAGQTIDIPLEELDELVVMSGDSLSSLAQELDVSEEEIMRENALPDDRIFVGQKLRIPPAGKHRVVAGETLLGIALKYGRTTDELRLYNNIRNDLIYPDQILVLNSQRPLVHSVRDGDSLWSIAARYKLQVRDVLSWNKMASNFIRKGDRINLYPGMADIRQMQQLTQAGMAQILQSTQIPQSTQEIPVALASASPPRPVSQKKLPKMPRFGEYYFSSPNKTSQPNVAYWEVADSDTKEDFSRAMQVLSLYNEDIASLTSESNVLNGWHIVIDPGHGGMDPGAIVAIQDGNGSPLIVTEDEYVYDIAVRLYRILRKNGASVSMTMLAPDHHIRNGTTPQNTFVHRKNEIYNDRKHNLTQNWRPVGNIAGLDLRKTIAEKQIKKAGSYRKLKGSLFISLHADNSPELSAGTAVLYDGNGSAELDASRKLASTVMEEMGNKAFIRQQALRVLKDNPASAAVLIEVRNVHYKSNAWALRSHEIREHDARKVADSLILWAQKNAGSFGE